MFDSICAYPLPAELFAQAIHPSEPLLAIGLSSGHVSTLKLPPVDDDVSSEDNSSGSGRRGSNGTGVIDTVWKTRRHKGSCRCLGFSIDGNSVYSGGTDGILKSANTATGQVTGKVAIPSAGSSNTDSIDAPTVVHALSPQTLLLATDSGALHLYDLRDPAPSTPSDRSKTAFTNSRPAQTHHPHIDYISSLTPLPASQTSTSGFSKQFLTTGGTTLALTDLRRGVLIKSEDQEELLLSSVYVTGLAAKQSSGSTGEKSLVGASDGVITLWEKGQWDDQDERIVVSKDKETLDCMAVVPNGIGPFGKHVAVGLGDGSIRYVKLGANKVLVGNQHDEVDGVVGIGFDVSGRMISGGGQIVKVWEEHVEVEEDEEDEEDEDESDDDDDDAASPKKLVILKRSATDSGDGDSGQSSSEDSDEGEKKSQKRKKKKKRGKKQASGSTFNFAGLD